MSIFSEVSRDATDINGDLSNSGSSTDHTGSTCQPVKFLSTIKKLYIHVYNLFGGGGGGQIRF